MVLSTYPVIATEPEVYYPERDGKPMADNTIQFRWILVIYYNLEWLFAEDPQVFVAGDLLWYPVEGRSNISAAPDVMTVFGRPKGDRGSYQQWKEDGFAPQVVFEILSPSNTATEMAQKLLFYDRYGVEEYYLYDPYNNELQGWLRPQSGDQALEPIPLIQDWVSPRLGIRFQVTDSTLQLFRPNGEAFATYTEVANQVEQLQGQLDQERQRTDQERQRADQERQRADQERQRAEALAERLRALGVDPNAL